MTRKVAAILLLAGIAAPLRAEVSVDHPDATTVIAHIQPGPRGVWQRLRVGLSDADVLNQNGDSRGDGHGPQRGHRCRQRPGDQCRRGLHNAAAGARPLFGDR